VVGISEGATVLVHGEDISSRIPGKDFDLDGLRFAVTEALNKTMAWLGYVLPDTRFAIRFSGRLDSSVVPPLTPKFLNDVLAFSFSLISEDDVQTWPKGTAPEKLTNVSEDLLSAFEVARSLGIPLFPVFRTSDGVLAIIPTAVKLCQHWRDFNVH